MQFTEAKLEELQKELRELLKEVHDNKLNHKDAADRVLHLKEQIDEILDHLTREARQRFITGK